MKSPSGHCEDIVIVDDDTLLIELVERALRQSERRITAFTDGQAALDHLQATNARVLFVDQRMPLMDGIDFLEQLRDSNCQCAERVYLCSSVMPPEPVCERALELGAQLLSKDVLCNRAMLLELLADTGESN